MFDNLPGGAVEYGNNRTGAAATNGGQIHVDIMKDGRTVAQDGTSID